MHVVATAGHVDHGKSTLVTALTGTDPDRLAEEKARGLSIELGYAWCTLPGSLEVSFVDVPGHERFVTTMLSGIGPVPSVLLVVAADDPWMPQTAEHLAALDALGVAHGVVAVTRSDLADPAAMTARAERELGVTSLAGAPVVAVSPVTGQGMDVLREHLADLLRSLPSPDPAADVRLWVDRCFHVKGAGTVVTGTLPAGRISTGDLLAVGGRTVRVRGLESRGTSETSVRGPARVAVNVGGAERVDLDRHSVLTTPGAWRPTTLLDVRLTVPSVLGAADGPGGPTPQRPILHVGATAVASHFRPLGAALGRLTCDRPLPLRVGDRALLRDPGSRRLWGVTVLDPAPPPLQRRGAARERAQQLAGYLSDEDSVPSAAAEIERRGVVRLQLLEQIGVPVEVADRARATSDGWLVGEGRAAELRTRMEDVVRRHDGDHPLDPGLPVAALAHRLGLASPQLVADLVQPPLALDGGRVRLADGRRPGSPGLPAEVLQAVAAIRSDLEQDPFAAPTAGRLQEVGLDPRAVTAAAKAQHLLHLGDGVVLLPGADRAAAALLAGLDQPFTTSQARGRLGTTRRVVLPLLAHLDRQGRTRRLPDDRREVLPPR